MSLLPQRLGSVAEGGNLRKNGKKLSGSGYVSLFGFALVLALLEVSARLAAPGLPVDPGKWPRAEIAQKLDQIHGMINDGQTADVIFVGSSMMAGGIDPVAFTDRSDVTSYNAAFAGPSTRTVGPWAVDILEPLLDPEVVVIGIQSREMNDNAPKGQTMYDKFITSPGYKQASASATNRLEGKLEGWSFFLRYRRAFRNPADLFSSDDKAALAEAKVRKTIGPRGTRIEDSVEYRATDDFITTLYDKMLIDFAVGGVEYDALIDLHNDLEERGVRLVVVNMPVTEDYWPIHADPEGDMAAYHAMLDRFEDETGDTIIDAEDAFPTSVAFREPIHLDIEGRAAFGFALADAWDDIMASEGERWYLACDGSEAPTCELSP